MMYRKPVADQLWEEFIPLNKGTLLNNTEMCLTKTKVITINILFALEI